MAPSTQHPPHQSAGLPGANLAFAKRWVGEANPAYGWKRGFPMVVGRTRVHGVGMRSYLRMRATGGVYFFTVNLAVRRGNTLLVDRIDALRDAFRRTRSERPFSVDAIVVLPDHLHCLWRLPRNDDDFPTRWCLIKSRFSRAVATTERRTQSRWRKGERGLWQRRYWEHLIRNDDDHRHHLDYIHFNPVKHGHARCAGDWPHSSLAQWIARGAYEPGWGCMS